MEIDMKSATKKLIAAVLAVLTVLTLASCAGNGEKKSSLTESSTPDKSTVGSSPAAPTEDDKSSLTPSQPFNGEDVSLALLSGSTGLGASKLIVDSNAKNTVNNYNIAVLSDPTEVIAGLKNGRYDLAALPVNVAAKLYNMPDIDVQVVALNTLGVLYMLEEDGNSVNSIADLRGKTVYTTGEGATPQYILEYILQKNGLQVGTDVTVIYRATAEEVSADIANVDNCIAMLPEPRATVVTKSVTTVRYALDMTEEWNKVADSALTQGCVVATKSFATGHKDALDAFLDEYKASVAFVNKADEAAANAVVEAGIIGKAPIAMVAIPKSNLVCYEGEQMKAALVGTLSVLFDLAPASVGGKLPGEDFYYAK